VVYAIVYSYFSHVKHLTIDIDIGVQVLSLENGHERQTVLDKFMAFFGNIQMPTISPVSQTEYTIKQQAITKDKRQQALNEFFSAVSAQVYFTLYSTHSIHTHLTFTCHFITLYA